MSFLITKYSMFASDYDGHCVLLDTGCNSPVVSQPNCLINVRRNKRKKFSNTLGGSYVAPYTAKSIPFGNVHYDPDIPFSVLSYYIVAERGYVRPSKDGMEFMAGFPTYIEGQFIEVEYLHVAPRVPFLQIHQ